MNILTVFLAQPRRLVTLGQALIRSGGFLLVVGLVGWAATACVSVVKALGGETRPEVALSDVLPGGLTWWMPEGFLGFAFVALLISAGFAVLHLGREQLRPRGF